MGSGDELSRRGFLGGATAVAAGLVGCGDDGDGTGGGAGEAGGDPSTSGGPGGGSGSPTSTATAGGGQPGAGGGGAGAAGGGAPGGGGSGGGGATPACEETEDDIEGPFYTPGAPVVDGALPGADELAGIAIQLEGRVLSATSCEPIAGATLDVWQADDDGAYDLEGFTLRGQVVTDAEGRYAVRTIVPGNYLNGDQYRPAHIHVKVSAPGHALLTTQLYFPDDPYNEIDPWFDERLLVTITPGEGLDLAGFEFVLA